MENLITLEEFKERMNNVKFVSEDNKYTCLTINGILLINEYELLDSNTINIHMLTKKIELCDKKR
ncbi:MAG: hypothetical protein RR359_03610 [Bacilli bacterium]